MDTARCKNASPAARMGRAKKVKACCWANNSFCANWADSRNARPIKLEHSIRCRASEIRDDNFWGDISKASIHNLQTSGSYQPKIVRLPAKGRQTMIRRLFVLLLLSVIVIGGSASVRTTGSANPEPCVQDHEVWLTHLTEKMETIKPGMTRWDVLKVFRAEGARQTFRMEGAPSVLRETFVSQDCPYFKIAVEFQTTFGGGNR